LQIANSRTGRFADWTSRGLVNSRTRQLANWTTRGCHRQLCVLSFPFWRHLRDRELTSPRDVQSASWCIRELSSYPWLTDIRCIMELHREVVPVSVVGWRHRLHRTRPVTSPRLTRIHHAVLAATYLRTQHRLTCTNNTGNVYLT